MIRNCFRSAKTKELIRYINSCKYFAFRYETTSLDVMSRRIVGMGISTQSGSGFYIPIGHVTMKVLLNNYLPIMELLAPCLEMNQDKIVGQNLNMIFPS
ncbi:MAG: hypothetical protein CM15mP22_6750 [Gammaproteobacteria bacterium]|nr:MAG: hypothetical protein CM15mP22_6750 [Gammaproteobacteria bacterium]